jgi:cation transport protein ChaC
MLTRERIRSGWIREMITSAGQAHHLLPEAAVLASLDAALADHPPGADVWLFGYGSLIWNPCFHFVERRVMRVHGWHRRFCLWTTLGRGTPEQPGLMLALERGGACCGVAFRIAAAELRHELEIVWHREMLTGAYRPRWVQLTGRDGTAERAIAFTINHEHPRYAGRLAEAEVVAALATACGPLGSGVAYLQSTVEHLRTLGIRDRPLDRLLKAIDRRYPSSELPSPLR